MPKVSMAHVCSVPYAKYANGGAKTPLVDMHFRSRLQSKPASRIKRCRALLDLAPRLQSLPCSTRVSTSTGSSASAVGLSGEIQLTVQGARTTMLKPVVASLERLLSKTCRALNLKKYQHIANCELQIRHLGRCGWAGFAQYGNLTE